MYHVFLFQVAEDAGGGGGGGGAGKIPIQISEIFDVLRME